MHRNKRINRAARGLVCGAGGVILLALLGACSQGGAEPSTAPKAAAQAGSESPANKPAEAAARASTPAASASTSSTSSDAKSPMANQTPKRDSNGVIVNAKLVSDAEWRKMLTPEQYNVTREKGTERAFTGKYWNTKEAGVYRCSNCGEVLFTSKEKFDSGCGWPSFYQAADKAKIVEHEDKSFGMVRTEVTCANCGAHLGHVFDDGPADKTGLRYCINSASIEMDKDAEAKKKDAEKADAKPEAKPVK